MKLPNFLGKLNQGAKKAFGENAQAMIESLLFAKIPPNLKRLVNMARLENATYEEVVTHVEKERELKGLEEGDDIRVPTKQQHDSNTTAVTTRVMAFSPPVLIQGPPAITAKKQFLPMTKVAN